MELLFGTTGSKHVFVKPKTFQPVIVLWHDASKEANECHDSPEAALAAYKAVLRESCGYWVGMNEDIVAVATDDDRKNTELGVGGCTYIPLGMISKITVLRKA